LGMQICQGRPMTPIKSSVIPTEITSLLNDGSVENRSLNKDGSLRKTLSPNLGHVMSRPGDSDFKRAHAVTHDIRNEQ
jgi:hypothetical protein